jgi:hypothetical protein
MQLGLLDALPATMRVVSRTRAYPPSLRANAAVRRACDPAVIIAATAAISIAKQTWLLFKVDLVLLRFARHSLSRWQMRMDGPTAQLRGAS